MARNQSFVLFHSNSHCSCQAVLQHHILFSPQLKPTEMVKKICKLFWKMTIYFCTTVSLVGCDVLISFDRKKATKQKNTSEQKKKGKQIKTGISCPETISVALEQHLSCSGCSWSKWWERRDSQTFLTPQSQPLLLGSVWGTGQHQPEHLAHSWQWRSSFVRCDSRRSGGRGQPLC